MLKGIHRQIIEIPHTDSPYFERALLVVRPGVDDATADTLTAAARELVHTAGDCSHLRRGRRRQIAARGVSAVFAALGGGAAVLLLQWLLP
jgi:hypothetical protein